MRCTAFVALLILTCARLPAAEPPRECVSGVDLSIILQHSYPEEEPKLHLAEMSLIPPFVVYECTVGGHVYMIGLGVWPSLQEAGHHFKQAVKLSSAGGRYFDVGDAGFLKGMGLNNIAFRLRNVFGAVYSESNRDCRPLTRRLVSSIEELSEKVAEVPVPRTRVQLSWTKATIPLLLAEVRVQQDDSQVLVQGAPLFGPPEVVLLIAVPHPDDPEPIYLSTKNNIIWEIQLPPVPPPPEE